MKTTQNKKYIAITIGPIDRIMTYTKSLKSFWAASYFMSYIGKTLVYPFFKDNKRIFLKPYLSVDMWNLKDGVGRFPDQYIFEAKEGDFNALINERNALFESLSKHILQVLNNKEYSQDAIETYLQNIIKIYICELNDLSEDNVIAEAHKAMDAMECMDCFQTEETLNYLEEYFENIKESNLLLEDAFGDEYKNVFEEKDGRLFETLTELAAQGSGKSKSDLFKDSVVANLQPKYKYVAYVSADGDNVGKTIAALGADFSSKLLEFNKKVGETVKEKKGQVIYAGGDDLLFLSQVDSVFDLIADIDKLFADKILTNDIRPKLDSNNLPSLSYGVYISYHKHPMGEALASSAMLLGEAKNKGRNRIQFTMRKHSGQSITCFIDKSINEKPYFPKFIEIINKFNGTKKDDDDSTFLHSFSHFLMSHADVIEHILSTDSNLLNNYFNHTFDDNDHDKYKDLVETLVALLQQLSNSVTDKKEAINQLYAMLRYIELIISKN